MWRTPRHVNVNTALASVPTRLRHSLESCVAHTGSVGHVFTVNHSVFTPSRSYLTNMVYMTYKAGCKRRLTSNEAVV